MLSEQPRERMAKKIHSKRSISLETVDREIIEKITTIDFSKDNLKFRFERKKKEIVKSQKNSSLYKIMLVAFLLIWFLSNNPSMTFDEFVLSIIQIIGK